MVEEGILQWNPNKAERNIKEMVAAAINHTEVHSANRGRPPHLHSGQGLTKWETQLLPPAGNKGLHRQPQESLEEPLAKSCTSLSSKL